MIYRSKFDQFWNFWNDEKFGIIAIVRFFLGICITILLHANFELSIYTIIALIAITVLLIQYKLFYDISESRHHVDFDEHGYYGPRKEALKKITNQMSKSELEDLADGNVISKFFFHLRVIFKEFFIQKKKDRKKHPLVFRNRGKYNPFFDWIHLFFTFFLGLVMFILVPSILIYYGHLQTILKKILIFIGTVIGIVIGILSTVFKIAYGIVTEYFFHISIVIIIILLLILISKKR